MIESKPPRRRRWKAAPEPAKQCIYCPNVARSNHDLCNACAVRKCRGTLIAGERCAVRRCPVDHPGALRWHRFIDRTIVLCGSHDARAGRAKITATAFLNDPDRHSLETPMPPAVMKRSA